MLVKCYISVKGINKYLSIENKLQHTYKDNNNNNKYICIVLYTGKAIPKALNINNNNKG